MDQFATFFLARVEERHAALSYSNAGHNSPAGVRGATARARTLERGGTVVGILETTCVRGGDASQLAPGDRIVLYTDGISEADERAGGELFGEERADRARAPRCPATLDRARARSSAILEGVRDFLGGVEPGDDMT